MEISSAQVVYSENFNSYSTGTPLVGQGGWSNSPVFFSSSADVVNGVGINTTPVAGNSSSSTGTSGAFDSVDFSSAFSGATGAIFTMDFLRAGTSGATEARAGFDVNNSSTGFTFGLTAGVMQFRPGVAGGTQLSLFSAPSVTLIATVNQWYRYTVDIDFSGSASTITSVTVENLTLGTAPVTAYFDSAATQTSLALGTDEAAWNRAYVRTGNSSVSADYVDNITLTAIPEPGTAWTLLLGLSIIIPFMYHRRVKMQS